jgi:hypothetical protein
MSLTWTQKKTKFQRLARDTTPGTLVQGEQDMNTGYHMFNAKFGRYYSRKQQFTDVITGQSIYQTPVDSIRIIGMTVKTGVGTNTYSPPIKEIRSEYEWRQIKTVPNYASSWITYYYVLGNDEIEVWPVPSSDIPNGIRYYYQPQDHDLSVDDIVSSKLSPAQTCTMVNGESGVTSTGSTFTNQMTGLSFQLSGVTDLTWYEIVDVPDSSTLTLKSAFVGDSASGLSFTIGQLGILPNEYQDVDIHYALGLFFAGKGNMARSQYHLGTEDKPGMFYSGVNAAITAYSLSTEGNVISDSDNFVSPWMLTPMPGISS